jgi:glutathione reductase (NADPH)
VPTVVFAHPTVGTTGLTEPEAVKRFGKENVKVYETKFAAMLYYTFPKEEKQKNPTAFKMIVEGPEERVVGLHILGEGTGEHLSPRGIGPQSPNSASPASLPAVQLAPVEGH